MNLFITGFGAFGSHKENPTSILVPKLDCPFQLLEVSFQAVEDFLDSDSLTGFSAWLMLGVHGSATKLHLELRAQNHIGPHPDVRGSIQGPAPIDPRAPSQLSSTLWTTEHHHIESEFQHPTIDAGDYLCNYAFFRGLQTFPELKIGFLHCPTFEQMNEQTQLKEIKRIIEELKSQSP